MNLSFGYNTNGFAHHKLEDALEIIADCGYRGVALTLDNYHCNPFTVEPADLSRLRQLLDKLQLRVVIETGARYLLNPQRNHHPTLISSARFGLTLDIGHAFCTETIPFRQVYGKSANLVRNVHIEDIRDRKHEHRMFGEGQLDFAAILRVLRDNKYTGLINGELPRDSHRATEVARASIEFLNAACQKITSPTSSSAAK